jgi:hypothetical protein
MYVFAKIINLCHPQFGKITEQEELMEEKFEGACQLSEALLI